MDKNIHQIAHDLQEATGVPLPFNGTDEYMIECLRVEFYNMKEEIRQGKILRLKLKTITKDLIELLMK